MSKSYEINTLAGLKRILHKGQVWHAYHHPMKKDLGNRKISEITTRAVGFESPRGTSWLYFPKAKDYKAVDERTFEVYESGELVLTYRMV